MYNCTFLEKERFIEQIKKAIREYTGNFNSAQSSFGKKLSVSPLWVEDYCISDLVYGDIDNRGMNLTMRSPVANKVAVAFMQMQPHQNTIYTSKRELIVERYITERTKDIGIDDYGIVAEKHTPVSSLACGAVDLNVCGTSSDWLSIVANQLIDCPTKDTDRVSAFQRLLDSAKRSDEKKTIYIERSDGALELWPVSCFEDGD